MTENRLFIRTNVFYGYVAPATRAIVAASQYNEYILQVLLFGTNTLAGFLSLTLKVNGYFRSTLKRLPLGASEEPVQRGQLAGGSSATRPSATPKRNDWKCLRWYHSWKHLNYCYYNRIHTVFHAILELFSHSLAVYSVVLSHFQLAPNVLLKVCRCVKAAAVLCGAVNRRLGPVGSALWVITSYSTSRTVAVLWALASF